MRRTIDRLVVLALAGTFAGACGGGGASAGSTGPGATGSATAPAASPSVAGRDAPPEAVLAVEGGDPVRGQIGTYLWLGTGSDAPWLAGAPMSIGAGEPLAIGFEPPGEIASWRARYVPAAQTDARGAVSLGDGAGAPLLAAPGVGQWTMEVQVAFPAGLGSASYYWRLDVR